MSQSFNWKISKLRYALVLMGTALCLGTVTAQASLPKAGNDDLALCADLELRVAGLFRVGTAGLYLERCDYVDRILESVPKQFSLYLQRSFRGDDLASTARDVLIENLDLASPDELPEALACMAEAYEDAEPGDRYDVIYRPGRGLTMYLNGEVLRHCDETEQAAKYFMIWFGERPFHRRMRDELISQARERN